MKTVGLFTRQELTKAKTRKAEPTISAETLKRLGPGAVQGMNPNAKTPDMKPSGVDAPLVYILGEAPTVDDDFSGKPFNGPGGRLLRSNLPEDYKSVTRFGYCVRTCPPKDRKPTDVEVEAFRGVVEADIARAKPAVVLVTGTMPFMWSIGKLSNVSIATVRGRAFPASIAGHECWICPVQPPALLHKTLGFTGPITSHSLRNAKEQMGRRDAPVWLRDLKAAYKLARSGEKPTLLTPEEARQGIVAFRASPTVEGVRKLALRVARSLELGKFTYDLETTTLRPYEPGAKIVSVSVSDKEGTYAWCVDHPEENWGPNRKDVWNLLRMIARCECVKVAQNAPFDLEWMTYHFGWDVPYLGTWDCTMAQAYVLDERKNGHGLNFLTALHYGIKVKSLTDVDRKNPQREKPENLLLYGGLDSKLTRYLDIRQRKLLKDRGLFECYELHRDGNCPVVTAEHKGFPVSQPEVKRQTKVLDKKIREVHEEVMGYKAIERYKARFGSFNPASPDHLTLLFRDLLGREEGVRGKKYSTDEDVLLAIGTNLAKSLLRLRKLTKLKSTYLLALSSEVKDNVIQPDGRVHTQYNTCATDTTRLSSEDPNLQNIPNRTPEGRDIRGCFIVGDDEVLVSTDYGQIEYRVIGMASKDPVVMDSCFTEYDVHKVWAKKIIKAYPDTFERRHGHLPYEAALKAFRGEVKNEWVFPQFFGSAPGSCATNLNMPRSIAEELAEEFWEYFAGVRWWQKDQEAFYNKHGYVEFLTGRRRHGPLNFNMICNTGIQGTAAEIIRHAWHRIGALAVKRNDPTLAPNLQIHDDLTGIMKKKYAADHIKRWIKIMLTPHFDFINVPLSVEVKVGPNWRDQKEIGRFRSDRLDEVDNLTLNF